jgi:hypothetical protein
MKPKTCIAALAVPMLFLASRSGLAEMNARQKAMIQNMKSYAESKPGMVNRIQQGSFYFKWLQAAPPNWERAYFKLGELDKGKFLSLQLTRKTPAGVELMIITDKDLSFVPVDAYRGFGKTMAEADKNISGSMEKSKIPITPELTNDYTMMIEELRVELMQR